MSNFPQISGTKKILITGASGGIGLSLTKHLSEQNHLIGAHYGSNKDKLLSIKNENTKLIGKKITSDLDCKELIDEYCQNFAGLDFLIIAIGAIKNNTHFKKLSENDWHQDIFMNLSVPFFLSRYAMQKMSANGGKIILFSTESALHSANPTSLGYGVAKAGIECLTKALAKEGAQNNILVNCIRPGFINSGFHERWQGKTQEDLNKRIEYIPLKKAGTPGEVSAMIAYLLSDWGNFITGQSIGITGGDWL